MTASRHISFLVTSGSGPAECQQAVAGVLDVMREEAELLAVDFDANGARTKHGYQIRSGSGQRRRCGGLRQELARYDPVAGAKQSASDA